jgi:hypothetical protein
MFSIVQYRYFFRNSVYYSRSEFCGIMYTEFRGIMDMEFRKIPRK